MLDPNSLEVIGRKNGNQFAKEKLDRAMANGVS
jgi:hypothetical protein